PGPDLEGRFDELRFSLRHPPALAHRLDRDTSGCLVLGRHPKALRRLGALFRNGRIEKVYWAVVDGQLPKTEGSIETGLKKLSRGSGWRMIVDPAAKGRSRITPSAVPSMGAPGSNCSHARAGRISCALFA